MPENEFNGGACSGTGGVWEGAFPVTLEPKTLWGKKYNKNHMRIRRV